MKQLSDDVGYKIKSVSYNIVDLCLLSIGDIILFNNEKCIVTHTNISSGNRFYSNGRDITRSSSGFLKNILSGKEFRANWSTVKNKEILYHESVE